MLLGLGLGGQNLWRLRLVLGLAEGIQEIPRRNHMLRLEGFLVMVELDLPVDTGVGLS